MKFSLELKISKSFSHTNLKTYRDKTPHRPSHKNLFLIKNSFVQRIEGAPSSLFAMPIYNKTVLQKKRSPHSYKLLQYLLTVYSPIFSINFVPNSEHFTSVAPSISLAKSYVTTFEAIVFSID